METLKRHETFEVEALAESSGFTKTDYSVALGALLEKELRDHYARAGFSQLEGILNKRTARSNIVRTDPK